MSQLSELFDFGPFFDNFDLILEGFWATVRLSAASAVLSLVIGTVLVSFRVSPVPVLRAVGAAYVNVLRNTPLTLVLLMCALGLNDTLALKFSDDPGTTYYWWAVTGLSAYTGAFVCEALRSGINTVPLGQAEAARSIGLTFFQSLRMIILPQAFRAISWDTVVLIAALIPLSAAFVSSGAAEAIAGLVLRLTGDGSPRLALLVVCVLTLVLGQFISNVATVLVMAPVAVSFAQTLDVSVLPFMMALTVVGAAAFLTPIATPVNLMVLQPGGYRFGDYWRLGLPLALVFLAAAVLYVPLVWPF